MNVLKEAGLLPPRINPDNLEKISIEAGCDVKAEDAHKEILESVNLQMTTWNQSYLIQIKIDPKR